MVSESSYIYYRYADELVRGRFDFICQHPKFDEVRQIISSKEFVPLNDVIVTDSMRYGLTASGLETGKIPFINIENLEPIGRINLTNVRYVDEAPSNLILEKNDMLISRSRLVGVCAVVTEKEERATFGSYIIKFKPKLDKILSLFLAKFINSPIAQAQIEYLKTGSTGTNINIGQIQDIRIWLPNINKQQEVLKQILRVEKEAMKLQEEAQQKWIEARRTLNETIPRQT